MLDIIMTLARLFHAEGKELYMVGGTVRDLLLHRDTSPDVDLATDARPDEIKRLVARTAPLAIVTVGEQFGTIRLHYPRATAESASPAASAISPAGQAEREGDSAAVSATPPAPSSFEGEKARKSGRSPDAIVADHADEIDILEITTYRSDQYAADSRKPAVTFGDTLEGDLLRRDFTINAMARDPLTGDIMDPYGGRQDLERQLIRAVGDDPERRFDEDPLRMLRAARFAAQLDFSIEPATAHAITAQAATLQKISKERIRDEFTKLLVTPNPSLGLRLLVDLGLMPYVVAEVLELQGVSQRPAHSKDVYHHVLRVVEQIPARPTTRWAALLHDIAKPRTRSVEDGKVHFFGHEDVGAVMARDILRRLKFDKPFGEHVSHLVKLHMRANSYLPDWTDGAVRRLMLDIGDGLPDLLDLSRADITSYRPEKVSRAIARVDELEQRCQWITEKDREQPLKSPLDGNELMELFGRGPGPWLRPLKDHLLGLVIDGQLAPDDRAGATEEARRYLAEHEQPATPPTPAAASADAASQAVPAPTPEAKRQSRAAARRQSRDALPASEPRPQTPQPPTAPASAPSTPEPRGKATPPRNGQPSQQSHLPASTTLAAPRRRAGTHPAPTTKEAGETARTPSRATRTAPVSRDELIRFLDEEFQVSRFRDLGPNGLQVIGKPEVRRVALGVSANLALFEAAAAWGADLIAVHHGLFLDRDPRPITARLKRRLAILFHHDITLLGYHLPLDAHPQIGNNVQWLRRLDFAVETTEFAPYHGQYIGAIGVREEPLPFATLVERVTALAGNAPKVYHYGTEAVRRLAVVTGGAPGSLGEAIAAGCDAFLTGEVAEGTQALAHEDGANFLAAGHYNTERFGIQALGDLLARHFDVETRFIEVPNNV
jgi:poly(A) polymerase